MRLVVPTHCGALFRFLLLQGRFGNFLITAGVVKAPFVTVEELMQNGVNSLLLFCGQRPCKPVNLSPVSRQRNLCRIVNIEKTAICHILIP